MWERTVTIGSAGKTFSMTGWKLGWAYGPANFIKNLGVVHQTAIYTCATTVQEAVARGFEREINLLDTPHSYFQNLSNELKPKMHYLFKVLQDNGFNPIKPAGGYFMIANWTNFGWYLYLKYKTFIKSINANICILPFNNVRLLFRR